MKYPFYIPCKQATYLISKRQETKLNAKEKIQLNLHIFICDVCKLFKKQTNYILKLVQQKQKEAYNLNQESKQKIKVKVDEIINGAK